MLNERLDRLFDYPFARLAALLQGVEPASGRAPLAMSIGEPQDPPPPLLAQTVTAHADQWGKYPPTDGSADFRRAVADWLNRRYALPAGFLDPDASVLPVAGTREALFLVGLMATPSETKGERPAILTPNPFYAPYGGSAVMAGADAVTLDAGPDAGFLPDLDALDEALLARTSVFYLCSPANPQGAAADQSYWAKAIALARRWNFVLVADECYAEVHDGVAPPPGALEACAESGSLANVLAFHSLSKRSNAAGLRSGFVAGDPALIRAFAKLRSYSMAGTPLPILAAAAALWRDEAHVEAMRARRKARFDMAEAILGGRFGFYRPAGGFFLWLDVGDGEKAALAAWREQAIRTLPGAYMTQARADGSNPGERYLRVALAHDLPVVEDGLTRLATTLSRL